MNMKKYILLLGFAMASVDCCASETPRDGGVMVYGQAIFAVVNAIKSLMATVSPVKAAVSGVQQAVAPTPGDQNSGGGGGGGVAQTSALRMLGDTTAQKRAAVENLLKTADGLGLTETEIAKFVKWSVEESFIDRLPAFQIAYENYINRMSQFTMVANIIQEKLSNRQPLSTEDIVSFVIHCSSVKQAFFSLKNLIEAICLDNQRLHNENSRLNTEQNTAITDLKTAAEKQKNWIIPYKDNINRRMADLEAEYQKALATLADAQAAEKLAATVAHDVAMQTLRQTHAQQRQNHDQVVNDLQRKVSNNTLLGSGTLLVVAVICLVTGGLFEKFKDKIDFSLFPLLYTIY